MPWTRLWGLNPHLIPTDFVKRAYTAVKQGIHLSVLVSTSVNILSSADPVVRFPLNSAHLRSKNNKYRKVYQRNEN